MPWDSAEDQNVSPVGALSVFKVIVDKNDEWQFQLAWTCSYTSQTNIMYFCKDSRTLFMGLDNGEIHLYKLA